MSDLSRSIIDITGFDGHAYGSWRGKGNLGRMCLRNFLLKDLPCCGTMIYGYNSKLSTQGVDTIMDYGRGLIEELKKVGDTEEVRSATRHDSREVDHVNGLTPLAKKATSLFFIPHSFGGIILAHVSPSSLHFIHLELKYSQSVL